MNNLVVLLVASAFVAFSGSGNSGASANERRDERASSPLRFQSLQEVEVRNILHEQREVPQAVEDIVETFSSEILPPVVSVGESVAPNSAARRTLREERTNEDHEDAYESKEDAQKEVDHASNSFETSLTHPVVDTDTVSEQLRNANTIIREHALREDRVRKDVRSAIDVQVERAIKEVESSVHVLVPPSESKNKEEAKKNTAEKIRDERVREIKQKIQKEAVSATEDVVRSLRHSDTESIEPIVQDSFARIAEVIRAETGIRVDLGDRVRRVSERVEKERSRDSVSEQTLFERNGLSLYQDLDNDGVSDYDEEYLYGTDPRNAYTAGATLTDGELVLLGRDVLNPAEEPVAVQSPRESGSVIEGIFEVHSITHVSEVAPVISDLVENIHNASSDAYVPNERASARTETLVFAGKGLPNSFVTLYIFSTPIVVTVKTDAEGSWTYVLDEELEDGSHELYVTMVDNSGRIVAKSDPVPFVSTAEAVDFSSESLLPIVPTTSPLDILRANLLIITGILFLIFAAIALIATGSWRSPESHV